MNAKLKQQKLKMWKENLKQLEEQLSSILLKKGAAAQEGDLSENAAYIMAGEDADTIRVQIHQVKKIIADLEGPAPAPTSPKLRGASKASAGKGR